MIGRLVLAGAIIVAVACGPAPSTSAGFVTAMDAKTLTEVESFTLRTPDGSVIMFRVGPLDLSGGGFPAAHLREHMALAQPIAVAWVERDGQRVATKVVDATWLKP